MFPAWSESQLWWDPGGSGLAPGCRGPLTSSSYPEGHGSTSQWEELEEEHLLFLGEPDVSGELEPFPEVSLGSGGVGRPSTKASTDHVPSTGWRGALGPSLVPGQGVGEDLLSVLDSPIPILWRIRGKAPSFLSQLSHRPHSSCSS